ncbi:MAG TPA: hypothetical protein DIU15_03390 [Deltaproteobacteria bacterium]|nr:hypothetical protein [Deltaproteobacteria bacterium]HCP45056.1 hypothetical protein [Deltaproteobacteria bacterium]|tara:strand:+ start:413 stop:1021 length:609 start_codon:yes stop_codon:yes gene_type:complete
MIRHLLVPFLIVFVTTCLLVPFAAEAKGKKKKKPLQLQALVDELAARGEVSDDMMKAIRFADRCRDSDKRWERGMEDQVPVNQLYEQLAGAVFCWQSAEKKAGKLGGAFEPVTRWVATRARYIETFRGYVWAIDAKLAGESAQVCRRLGAAAEQASAGHKSAEGLIDLYTVEAAKMLAARVDADVEQAGAMIAREIEVQKCR